MKYIKNSRQIIRMKLRIIVDRIAKYITFCAALFSVLLLIILLIRIFTTGMPIIDWGFLTGRASTEPESAGILGAILGTFWMIVVTVPVTMFFGISTAIYMELYMKKGKLRSALSLNIANLAGVPSIVYGILGLTIFVRIFGLGNVILAGGLTLALLVLPITIVTTQEAIRAIPQDITEGAYGIGATKEQVIRTVILPAAIPGIVTGFIFAISRAIGETAPLVVIGIPTLLLPLPTGIFDKFTILPMQIYYWTMDSVLVADYAELAAGAIIILLCVLLLLNSIAFIIRKKYSQFY